MFSNFKQLVDLCSAELLDRGYGGHRRTIIAAGWDYLSQWMNEHKFDEFSEEIGYMFCDEQFGGHLLSESMNQNERILLRSVRMLISYQKTGDFEFRSPKVEKRFSGDRAKPFTSYLSYAQNVLHLSDSTLANKEAYLYAFYKYLDGRALALDNLDMMVIEEFFNTMSYTLPSRHNCNSTLRIFLRYAFDNGMSAKDLSIYIMSDNYKNYCKLPTTYEESEISRMISAVDRASPTGKRDYVILLLAAEYGWRSKDIVNLRFSQIDWDKNIINFAQSKTDVPVEYPLLSSVGNAIIDYMKNGRPNSDYDTVIVSAVSGRKGTPLTSPTVHSIVTRYMRKADIKDWDKKKHGAHSLRHSLASNMLKNNVTMPVISIVIGHQRTETTKIYLTIDVEKLSQCTLPMPIMNSPHYRMEAK